MVPLRLAITKDFEVNPMHPDFAGGAKFDGVTDDTAAIQAAHAYAAAASAPVAYPGIAKITGIIQRFNGDKARGFSRISCGLIQYSDNTQIYQWNLTTGIAHTETCDLFLGYANPQDAATQPNAVIFDVLTTNGGSGMFGGVFRQLRADQASHIFRWNGQSPATGSAFWNNSLDDIYATNIDGSLILDASSSPLGNPTNWCKRLTHLGSSTTVTGAQSLPASTITVGDTSKFPSSGAFSIDGIAGTISYTGKTATTFTGCTGGTGTTTGGKTVRRIRTQPAIELNGGGARWEFESLDIEDWTDQILHAINPGTMVTIKSMHLERHQIVTTSAKVFQVSGGAQFIVDGLDAGQEVGGGTANVGFLLNHTGSAFLFYSQQGGGVGSVGRIGNLYLNKDANTTGSGTLEVFSLDTPPTAYHIGARRYTDAKIIDASTPNNWLRAVISDQGEAPVWDASVAGSLPTAGATYLGRTFLVTNWAGTTQSVFFRCRRLFGGGYAWMPVNSTIAFPTYGTTVTADYSKGDIQRVTVTDTNAFTIAAVTNTDPGRITFDILNSSGGVMGTITWDASFHLAGSFTNPANGKRRTITFASEGSNWFEVGRAAADI
jgi:hypothetical protein